MIMGGGLGGPKFQDLGGFAASANARRDLIWGQLCGILSRVAYLLGFCGVLNLSPEPTLLWASRPFQILNLCTLYPPPFQALNALPRSQTSVSRMKDVDPEKLYQLGLPTSQEGLILPYCPGNFPEVLGLFCLKEGCYGWIWEADIRGSYC